MEHESQPINPLDQLSAIRSFKRAGGRTSEWRKALCEFFDESPDERLALLEMQEIELLHAAGRIDDDTFSRSMKTQTENFIESYIEMNEL